MAPRRAIRVACAVMEKKGRLFAAKRGPTGANGGRWELPGGKIEPGETPEACVRRELWEELGIQVEPLASWPPCRTVLPGLAVRLFPVVCRWRRGAVQLREHESWDWFTPEELLSLEWSAPDRPVIRRWLAQRKAKEPS